MSTNFFANSKKTLFEKFKGVFTYAKAAAVMEEKSIKESQFVKSLFSESFT